MFCPLYHNCESVTVTPSPQNQRIALYISTGPQRLLPTVNAGSVAHIFAAPPHPKKPLATGHNRHRSFTISSSRTILSMCPQIHIIVSWLLTLETRTFRHTEPHQVYRRLFSLSIVFILKFGGGA